MSKKISFLVKMEIKAAIFSTLEINLTENRMPCLMIFWNPEDRQDVGLWTDANVDRQYLAYITHQLAEQIADDLRGIIPINSPQ